MVGLLVPKRATQASRGTFLRSQLGSWRHSQPLVPKLLRSEQKRSMEYRLETSVVTRIGVNTTPIK